MKLTKRRRDGYSVLNNDYHSPPHTLKPPIQSDKTPISSSILYPDRLIASENSYSYKCTQCPPKDFKQDIRNLSADISNHLRHAFLRLRGRPLELKTPEIFEKLTSDHAASCPRLLAARSVPNSPLVTTEDRYNAIQHFAQVEKIKNEMEKEKKRIGRLRWRYWKWMDGKQGTRLAEERLGERVEVRREEEGGRRWFLKTDWEKGDGGAEGFGGRER